MEAHIRAIAPALREKKEINLTICLGGRHSPEQYSAIPIDIEVLHNDPFNFPLHENPKDYPRRLLFAFVLGDILANVGIEHDPNKLMASSMEDLEKVLIVNKDAIKARITRFSVAPRMWSFEQPAES
jgi:hypothetical protein